MGGARHQYGISALVTQTSFCEGSSGDLARRRLFSQAICNRPIFGIALLAHKRVDVNKRVDEYMK